MRIQQMRERTLMLLTDSERVHHDGAAEQNEMCTESNKNENK
jgi:hypothetical protein